MAIAIIEIDLGSPGYTGATLDEYPLGSDTPTAAVNLPLTAQTNRTGVYRCTTTAALSGIHQARAKNSGGVEIAAGCVRMSDTAAVHVVYGLAALAAIDGSTVSADVDTIKTKSVTVDAGGTTFPASVGTSTYAGGAVASVTGNVGGIAGTTQTLDALQTALNSAHGAGSWATATGFSTHSAADVLSSLGTGSWITAAQISATVGWGGSALPTSFAVSDKTGFKLASDGLALVTAWTVDVTGTVSGNAPAATALSTAIWTGTKAGYLDVAISSRGTGAALDAVGVRAAVGLLSANLDTQLDALPTAAEIRTALEADGSKLDVVYDDWLNGGRLDLLLDAVLEDTGTTLPAQIAALELDLALLAGSGNNTIQFAVTDEDTAAPVQNAQIDLRLNGTLKATGDTEADGALAGNGLAVEATGDYELAITCAGYNSHTETLTVTAGTNATHAVELSPLDLQASSPGLTTLYWTAYKSTRVLAGANEVTLYLKSATGRAGGSGVALQSDWSTGATNASGIAQFTNCVKGASYLAKVGDHGREFTVRIPASAGASYSGGDIWT